MSGAEAPRRARVAVVAVHGIATHPPGWAAREVAGLVRRGAQVVREAWVHLPLDQRLPWRTRALADDPDLAGPLGILPGELGGNRAGLGPVGSLRSLVAEVRGDDGPAVDVHEIYWADLSSSPAGTIGLLRELWVVLLHIPRLGERVVREVPAEAKVGAAAVGWGAYRALRGAASEVLTGWIAGGNLALLGQVLALLATVAWVAGGPTSLVGICLQLGLDALVGAGAMAALAGWLLGRGISTVRGARSTDLAPALRFSALPPLVGLASAFAVHRWVAWDPHRWLMAVSALAAVAGVVWFVALRPSALRPRPRAFLAAALLGVGAVWLEAARHPTAPLVAMLHVVEWTFTAVTAGWLLFHALVGVALLGAVALVWRARGLPGALPRVVQGALGTSLLSLQVPAVGYALVSLAFWSAFVSAAGGLGWIPAEVAARSLALDHGLVWLGAATGTDLASSVPAFAQQIGGRMAALSLVALGAYLVLLVLPAAWTVLPSAWLEVRPWARLGHPDDDSVRLGVWLSEWGRTTWWSVLGLLGAVPAGLFALPWVASVWDDRWNTPVMLGGAAVLIVVQAAFGPVRSAFDLLLDVDSYFRDTPRRSTPRRGMFERAMAVLARCRGYDELIVVAHSQGAILFADLLRLRRLLGFLPGLPRISLVTMGAPIRQLYQVALPRAYDWLEPDPCGTLQVARWHNCYTTGDYVGRSLWSDDPGRWRRGAVWRDGARSERCLGAGGHMHYWDGTFPEVGEDLRSWIDEATGHGAPPPVEDGA